MKRTGTGLFVQLPRRSSVWNLMSLARIWCSVIVLAVTARVSAARSYVDPDVIDPEVTEVTEVPTVTEVPDTGDEPPHTSGEAQDRPPPPHDDRDRWDRWRIAGGAGIRFGSFHVNSASTGTAMPFHLDVGARKNRLFVYAEYEVMGLTVPGKQVAASSGGVLDLGDGSGLMHRAGANARYTFGRVGEHDGGFDAWAEVGAGLQHFRWDAGGVWTRPDLSLGIGGSILGLGREEHGGFSIGLRVTLAHRNDVAGAPAVCGGPCDEPTTPTGWDRSFLFDMTVLFGK